MVTDKSRSQKEKLEFTEYLNNAINYFESTSTKYRMWAILQITDISLKIQMLMENKNMNLKKCNHQCMSPDRIKKNNYKVHFRDSKKNLNL